MKIGVDLGGTNIRAGLIGDQSIIRQNSIALKDKEDLESTLSQLKSIIHSVHKPGITGIGIGVPSIVDLANGIVYDVVNIPSWKEVRLKDILEKEFDVPVYINNDVNCFVLGEKHFGHGKKHKTFVGITIGTGIGSGIIIQDKLYSGSNCGAGEIGYLPYKDRDFEHYCSANFFERIYNTTAHETFLRAEQKDAAALKLWEEFGSNVGVALRSVVYAYDPEAIIMGGSISKALKYFQESMYAAMQETYFPNSIEKLKIYVSDVKHISMLGAAAQVDHHEELLLQ